MARLEVPEARRAPGIMATLFMEINGKVALITGSAKRVGREIALELARRGAQIAVHYRSDANAAREVAQNRGAIFHAELTDYSAIEKMFQGIDEKFGRLDILVNSASVFSPSTAEDTTPDDWDLQMDTNAKAPFFVAQKAARLMARSGTGKIINIADVAGEVVWPGYLPYSISKAALIAVNRGLAKAYAPYIQVNAIAPGPVLFPEYYTEEQKHAAVERTLLKRAGSARDIVNAVVFLIENDYITGETIHVDGGRHLV
ncbi:MAG TPA: SDR family oxidoreductase [Pyrinomonadaceae bacterium]|nr:SDR family oxidoreductase [Pyrinomonadaceae bacterium]